MAGFRRSAGGATARFAAAQAAIIRSLVSQVSELVGGEGMPQPDVTDTFLRHYDRAEEREQAREQRSAVRRAWRWVTGA